MERFDLRTHPVEPHRPDVLLTRDEGRAVLLALPAGEQLDEHEVHERAWVTVVAGEVEFGGPDGAMREAAGPGTLVVFDPKERHVVAARSDARLLLILSPWPGEGRTRGFDA